jgi:site-specific DNA recombinase
MRPSANLQVMRAVIYTRISSDSELVGAGVERQRIDCLALAKRLGVIDPLVIVDNDVSAFDRRRVRPGWRDVVTMIKSGDLDVLVAWHTDRLYRRLADLEELVTLIEQNNVAIHTVTSGDLDLTTASGRMTARILGSVSQHESEHKSERIVRAHQQIAETGGWKGGPRPFGYEADGVTIRLDEAAVARSAAKRILAGESANVLAQWASEKLGRTVTQRSLVRSLTSPHIAGLRIHWTKAERERWIARRASGEVVGDQPIGLIHTHTRQGTWPAVLPISEWRALVNQFERKKGTRRPRRSMLAGLLRCAKCGASIGWGEGVSETRSGRYATYRCITTTGGCGGVSIRADATDEYVAGIVLALAATRRGHSQLVGPDGEDTDEREALQRRLDELADAFGDGELTRVQYARQRERILVKLSTMDAAATEARSQRDVLADTAEDRWRHLPTARKSAAIRAFIRDITVFPVGRGVTIPIECRVFVKWIDDAIDRTVDEMRDLLPDAPPIPSDAERRAKRNARDRAKRRAAQEARRLLSE